MGSQAFNKSYTYDTLNRLSTMAGSGEICTGLSWSFDVWGNRTAQTETGGTCNHSALTYDVHNRITNPGYSYDAAGNLRRRRHSHLCLRCGKPPDHRGRRRNRDLRLRPNGEPGAENGRQFRLQTTSTISMET